jgi:hypothetical protein
MPKQIRRAAVKQMTKVSEKVETKIAKENGNGSTAATASKKEEAVQEKPAIPSRDEIKAQIEERIAKFQRMNQILETREVFMEKKDQLIAVVKTLGSDFDVDLDSPNVRIVLKSNGQEAISISNNELVYEFVRMLLRKVTDKISGLEAEILM